MSNLIEKYLQIKDEETDDELDNLIKDCFRYGIFKRKPSRDHQRWFKNCHGADYPTDTEDLKKTLLKKLKQTIRWRKKDAAYDKKCEMQRAKRGFSNRDVWNLYDWFLEIMPRMLKNFRRSHHGYPCSLFPSEEAWRDDKESEKAHNKWNEILDRLIFLLGEMQENTCSMKNPYELQKNKIDRQFRIKYGYFGDGLKTKEQREEEKRQGSYAMLFPSDFPDLYPDYEELERNYMQAENEITAYRNKCKDEFFALFAEHFWNLWD